MNKIKVSIIVCTYNRDDVIGDCLESLQNQTAGKDDFEVLIINNNSTDGTEKICSDFLNKQNNTNFKYFTEKKQGLSFARNRGIRESGGNIISFIDDDAVACKEYADEVINFFSEYKHADALGGKILPEYETGRPAWMSVFLEPIMSVIDLGDKVKEFPKNKFPVGANMIIKKEVFEKTGVFNENLGRTGKNMLGGEEKDLFYRIKNAGGKIYYSPKPWVFHQIPDSRLTKQFVKKQALGIGYSEKIRSLNTGKAEFLKSVLKETAKWFAVLLLFVFYSAGFKFSKAEMIVFFRYWVSKGFFASKL
ncbi:MAG: glycosyltransferase [Chlorobi bacterium]|nr:glycosyltransferase [Chlorobiota bacterium]